MPQFVPSYHGMDASYASFGSQIVVHNDDELSVCEFIPLLRLYLKVLIGYTGVMLCYVMVLWSTIISQRTDALLILKTSREGILHRAPELLPKFSHSPQSVP